MYINVIAALETNMSLIDEIPKPTSKYFEMGNFGAKASQWSCFTDASKKWQVDLEILLQEHPKSKKACCAFQNACECMKTSAKYNDYILWQKYCKDDSDYKNYFKQIEDIYAETQDCKLANVGPESFVCSAATNLLVNNKINYIFCFIISFLLTINSFHLNLI